MPAKKIIDLLCFVNVQGEASDPDDAGLPGDYLIEVRTSEPVDPTDLALHEAHAIASAVLAEFHDNRAIEVPDDFTLTVRLDNGLSVKEEFPVVMDGQTFAAEARYWGPEVSG